MVYPGPLGYETDLAALRSVFGDDAELVMRGLSVASSELDLSDALALVLDTMHDAKLGHEMTDLKARVARVMWPSASDGLDEIQEGPITQLAKDVQTTLGVYRAGTDVRVLERMSDGRILIGVLDRNQTVFPVEESALRLDD